MPGNTGNIQQEKIEPENFAVAAKEEPITPAFHGDKCFFRMVAAFLGGVAILSLLSIAALSLVEHLWPSSTPAVIPESITALGSASVGALAGLFTGTQSAR
ncbi:hypothetical protein [Burkholderia pseudomallei]|uniref:hypothetical protein n=1 Tax=Burkholderia pseudomallei TaxID=28450 RepID=UPI001009BB67|nr:hypothetical protein [Burkholderia pseudomallei]